MPLKDITVRILEQIRDEMKGTREELRGTREDLSARIDTLRVDLGARIDRTNDRLEAVEHTLLDLAGQQVATVRYLKGHVADDITDLRTRVSALEAKLD